MNIKDIKKQISEFREKLSKLIEDMPDGVDGINKLNNNCGTVMFSTVAKHNLNLSPSYYLNKDAKQRMQEIIARTQVENLERVIEKIIQTGSIPLSSGQRLGVNPEFVAKLWEMWLANKLVEHDRVRVREDVKVNDKDGLTVPQNTWGTIVHIHNDGEAYEVEFLLVDYNKRAYNKVVMLKPIQVSDIGADQ